MLEGAKILQLQDTLFNNNQTILTIGKNKGDNVQFNILSIEELMKITKISDEKITSITSTQMNSPSVPQIQGPTSSEIKDPAAKVREVNSQKSPFTAPLEVIPEQEIAKAVPMKKYTFNATPESFIQLPPNYSTDEEYEKRIIDLINSGFNGWSKVLSENSIDVYKNDDPNVKPIMAKSYVTINYSKAVLFEAIDNIEIRSQWDLVFSSLEKLEKMPETNQEILSMIIKSKMPFSSDRDMVQLKTYVQGLNGKNNVLIYVRSVEHPKKPITKKYVRAIMHIAGYYIEEIEPNKCKVAIVTQMNPDLPEFVLQKMVPKTVLLWVERVQNGCKIVLSKK